MALSLLTYLSSTYTNHGNPKFTFPMTRKCQVPTSSSSSVVLVLNTYIYDFGFGSIFLALSAGCVSSKNYLSSSKISGELRIYIMRSSLFYGFSTRKKIDKLNELKIGYFGELSCISIFSLNFD